MFLQRRQGTLGRQQWTIVLPEHPSRCIGDKRFQWETGEEFRTQQQRSIPNYRLETKILRKKSLQETSPNLVEIAH